ncbi:MAG: hypothetical protein PVG35_18425 [Desulfobacterales bacterium]|jgi:hypothetical protein
MRNLKALQNENVPIGHCGRISGCGFNHLPVENHKEEACERRDADTLLSDDNLKSGI